MILLDTGIAQGSILAPSLFNIYLEEALKSEKILNRLIEHGKLLAYADDLMIMNRNK